MENEIVLLNAITFIAMRLRWKLVLMHGILIEGGLLIMNTNQFAVSEYVIYSTNHADLHEFTLTLLT